MVQATRPNEHMRLPLIFAVLALTLSACQSQPTVSAGDEAMKHAVILPAGDLDTDRGTLRRLYAEARALARPERCENNGDCAAAPLGAKACGGPQEYLVYCRRSTDVAALRGKLVQVERFEKAFNREHGIGSTCEYIMEPAVACASGKCQVVAAP